MSNIEKLAKENGMTVEFVNWFFETKKDGCGNVWFMMMAAMWEGWKSQEARCRALAAENAHMQQVIGEVQILYYESDGIVGYHLNGEVAKWDDVMPDLWAETPATDDFLAEVRAGAIKSALDDCSEYLDRDCIMKSNGISYDDAALREIGAMALQEALLHKGAAQ
ncbi:hypothetical protein I5685_16080 [Citrobacter koseri]|uniref:hypothetical protein n=1 Tax=Citrobacter koseri TaxID=545 RepID=UPI00190362B5|nr:hypothetical protein [Citrobacter koseri]MBJ9826240.1 hypothetical protein [Citrobacter koseri]